MKIFNWVQRRFHHGALKDGLAQNVKKAEAITNDADKQALLKQVALVDVLDGWKDGILTIGTLGFDSLKYFNQQNDYFILESEEEEEEEEAEEEDEDDQEQFSSDIDDDHDENVEEEEDPLIFTTFEQSFDRIRSNIEANDVITSVDGVALTPIKTNYYTPEIDQRKRRGERITLAELFLADSDMKKKPDCDEIQPNCCKKPLVHAKNGLSFAKKFIPHVGDDSRPIKKIHQMMRRMLKRKIHPELEGKGNKMCNQSKPAVMDQSKGNEGDESVSLLHTAPGATI